MAFEIAFDLEFQAEWIVVDAAIAVEPGDPAIQRPMASWPFRRGLWRGTGPVTALSLMRR